MPCGENPDLLSKSNCLTEIFFDSALERARELDAHFQKTGKPKGPLHGLPVSLKDSFRVIGHDASIGIASLCFKPCKVNSTLVDMLLDAGAVLYCKTNVPQTLMALDSHNNIFGRTLNPANLRLTAGGSSGGEGALVALRGSILGVGTDVGGSIRIPAMCNGLYGIKPSHGRVPYAGQENGTIAGAEVLGIRASAGPIAHSVRDCELLMRVVGDGRAWNWDPEVVPQSWKLQAPLHAQQDSQKPVVVGVVRTEGVTTPLPPIARFMDEVANTLRKTSSTPRVEVVDLDLTDLLSKCQSLANAFFSIDGANHMFDLLEATSEPLSPWLRTRLRRRPRADLSRVTELQARRTELQTAFLDVWRRHNLDAIVCPVAPHPVPEVDRWNTASYTSAFVLLDYAAATLPVRTVRPGDLKGEVEEGKPLSSWDKYNRELWTKVDRSVYLNSPLCVQVVGQKLMEKKLLGVMGVLDKVFRDSRDVGREQAKL